MAKKNECEQIVLDYFEKQKKFKQVQAQFNKIKERFNDSMEDYFNRKGITKFTVDGFAEGSIIVNKVQKSNIEFNPSKLEKVLGKEISKQIIIKKYEVMDIEALITYLKECNVDPKIFKSFLNVTKTVDEKELDRLGDLGKITDEQLEGCYTVKKQKPYFTVTMK